MRTKQGIVTSAKAQDTVTVEVHRHAFHPIYQKRFRKSSKFLADCKGIDDLQEGDAVTIAECKPLSKRKYFRVTEVTNRIPRVSDLTEEQDIDKAIHREKEAPEESKKNESGVRSQESGENSKTLSEKEEKSDGSIDTPISTS